MGANQSNGEEMTPHTAAHLSRNALNRGADGHKKSKAKPGPPTRPTVTLVTHNTAHISWYPPRHNTGHGVIAYTVEICGGSPSTSNGGSSSASDKEWRTLTKACQGTRYDARYLTPDSCYTFRVRAENVYGTGKPSPPSEVVTTKLYDTEGDTSIGVGTSLSYSNSSSHIGALKEKSPPNLKRRHSFNVQLDGRVTTILSHSDIVLDTSSSHSSSTPNHERSEKFNSLTRNHTSRTSLGSGRKSTTPIMLPGTGTDSLNRLRESRNSLRSSTSDYSVSTTAGRDSVKNRFRESRSSIGSSISDIQSPSSMSGEEARKRHRGSRGSLQSSTSDLTVSNSRDGGSSSNNNSRDGSLCDCTVLSLSDHQDLRHPNNSDSHRDEYSSSYVNHNNNINSSNRSHSPDGDIIEDCVGERSNCCIDECDETEGYKRNDADIEKDDDITRFKEGLRKLDISDGKLKFDELRDKLRVSDAGFSQSDATKGYYESLENPWEKVTSPDGVSQRILAAPFCDGDFRLDRQDLSPTNHNASSDNEGGDFRTLRSVLQSSNMLVRTVRHQPELVGVVMADSGEARMLTRGRLTTIVDADEEDETVRVTTL